MSGDGEVASMAPVSVGDGLVMRAACAADVDALIGLNTAVFDGRVTAWTADLLSGRHPTVGIADFTVVEDAATGAIVSSAGLISQTWRYDGVPIRVGRPELVATDPAYRRRGLVRRQFEALHARSLAKGEVLQVITGVDWFYRQFGYDMGVGLWGSRCLDAVHLPSIAPDGAGPYRVRAATAADHPFIRALHAEANARVLYSAARSAAEWEYEFGGRSPDNTRRRDWCIVEGADGAPVGFVQYLPVLASPHVPLFRVYQVELAAGVGYLGAMPSLVRGVWEHARSLWADGRLGAAELTGLELALEREHPLFHVIPADLSRPLKSPPWYLRVPDWTAFLTAVAPALESHLVGSPAEGFTGQLRLDFYRGGLRLTFDAGRITAIEPWAQTDDERADAHFPETSFLRLVAGWRRFGELADSFADCWGTHAASVLLDALFPSYDGKVWVLA
ncbi:MAG: hypothetical protein JWM93_14 [Frankiales bacterium]|nr:hypothetical protein [Frankiales bacterium]